MPRQSTKSAPELDGSSREKIRQAAARLFADRGFARASMRELARAADMSLAGLYHHFPGKNELLFEIQRDAYERLLAPLKDIPDDIHPAEKIAALIHNHLRFFITHITEMKVLSHEAEVLDDALGRRIRRQKRRYFDIYHGAVIALLAENRRRDLNPRTVTMMLFGMINWIYNWYRPRSDGNAEELARQMTEVFLHGIKREH